MTSPFSISFEPADGDILARATTGAFEPHDRLRLRLAAERISLIEGFEELLCLPMLRGVDRYPHQERTALRVMRRFRGRAILGDEVGLGKTIEACLIIKESLLRGLARRVLVLCPPSLVEQWQQELWEKFALEFVSTADPEFRAAGGEAWSAFPHVVASLSTARHPRHADALKAAGTDLVVVDEAHHLRRRTSSAWRLVSELPRKYVLLLTATPVQNELDELYNLVTLLRPGQLGTPAQFRKRFVDAGDKRRARNVGALRELVMDVMVRNTRSTVDVQLPPRRSRTLRVTPRPEEKRLLDEVHALVRARWGERGMSRMALTSLQLEAGSCPAALAPTLARMGLPDLAARAASIGVGAKLASLLEVLRALRAPALVFTRFLHTLEALARFLEDQGLRVHRFHGSIPAPRREEAMRAFQQHGGVMLLSEVGSEGRNLQFCHNLVNFDLPWNPMRIEQRVGRLHRIGQTRPIHIVNLCLAGSLEDHLLRILDEKLNMFELVVGEMQTILGPLEEDEDFEDVLADLRARASSDDELADGMDALGQRMVELRRQYEADRGYDESLFGTEFEVGEG